MLCLKWVKSRHPGLDRQCPLYPRKRTSAERIEMSVKGHFRTHAAQQNLRLFNHLVGELLQVQGYLKAERLGGREVDNQIVLLRPLYR